MKKKISLITLLASLFSLPALYAQTGPWDVIGTTVTTTTPNDCEVGGTMFLKSGLLDMTMTPDNSWRSLNCGSGAQGLWLNTGNTILNGTYIQMHAPHETYNPGGIEFVANSPAANGQGFRFFHHDISSSTDNALGQLDNWGNMTINGGILQLYSTTYGGGPEQWRSINCGSTGAGLYMCTGNNTADGTYIQMHAPGHANPGAMEFVSNSPGGNGTGFNFVHHDFANPAAGDNRLVHIDNWGHMTVNGGTLDLFNYALGSGVDQWRSINCGSAGSGLYLCTGTSTSDGTFIQMHSPGHANPGAMEFVSNSPGAYGTGFTFIHHDFSSNTDNRLVQIDTWGRVVIGADIMGSTPADYKLYVQGGILTEHIKVALHATSYWADYVFNDDYKLMPLARVENYINKHKHLPDVPSAEEVVKEGIDLGNMDAKLLQKIEELTLYVIQQQKEINELKVIVNSSEHGK